MLSLPKSTEFNKRIPKQKFYENLSVTPAMKRVFIDQIKVIYWRNKIAATTMNLAAGDTVTEVEVFEIKLASPQLDISVLRQIDKEIPYHIIFLLECDGKSRCSHRKSHATCLPGQKAIQQNNICHQQNEFIFISTPLTDPRN